MSPAPEFGYLTTRGVGGGTRDTMINLGQWPTAPDATMLTNLFAAAKAGTFGPIDLDHLHATGISSGAYMTSRMAFSYEVRWAGDAAHGCEAGRKTLGC